jgi:aspartyl-tRNA(Asn)/glutamyl-tRNA(Gln) amidotransferase subunit A
MALNELADLTIAEASDLLKSREISAQALTEAVLAQIATTEPLVKAYKLVLADEARAAAVLSDRARASGEKLGLLQGIPVAVKDLCNTRGIPTEAGSRALEGNIPAADATVVRRLHAAGAILVGKTVTHEFAVGVNTPPTVNPWDSGYYPGGSSIGSAVSLAVRSCLGAIGTDSGGSIRIPAAINGVVGLKPTFGRVSRSGVFPMSSSLDHVGPMARTVEDCAILLQVIAGADPEDATSAAVDVHDYQMLLRGGVKDLRIGVERGYSFYEGLTDDVRSAVDVTLRELEVLGARIVELDLPELSLAATIGLTILLADTYSVHRRLLGAKGELYDKSTRLFIELGGLVSADQYIQAHKARSILRTRVADAFRSSGLDALVCPTIPIATVRLGQMGSPLPNNPHDMPVVALTHNTYLANVTGQPALSVPCGFSTAGLPIGLQLIGRPFDEGTILRIGREYERLHEWWRRAPAVAAGSVN